MAHNPHTPAQYIIAADTTFPVPKMENKNKNFLFLLPIQMAALGAEIANL
jgi:hypothetical protein